MGRQQQRPEHTANAVAQAASREVDDSHRQRPHHGVDPSARCQIGLVGHVAAHPVPGHIMPEVPNSVRFEIAALRRQAETHQVRPERGLAAGEIPVPPGWPEWISKIVQVVGAVQPARLVGMERRTLDRPQIERHRQQAEAGGNQPVPHQALRVRAGNSGAIAGAAASSGTAASSGAARRIVAQARTASQT